MTPHEHIVHHIHNGNEVGYECLMCGAFADTLADLLLIDCEPAD